MKNMSKTIATLCALLITTLSTAAIAVEYKATYQCTVDIANEFNKEFTLELDGPAQKATGYKSKEEWSVQLVSNDVEGDVSQKLIIGKTQETISFLQLTSDLQAKQIGARAYPQYSISCVLSSLVAH